jgi:transcriptional regulator with XRE-family HTH domain
MNSFGVLFGRLIREKRGIESFSQDALAAETGLTKARISDIETGKIANPQAKTVDSLCVALNISRDERAACHAVTKSRLPPRLLETLARRFGHVNPDASELELEVFLIEKAAEFWEMHDRLEKLSATDGRISDLVKKANVALGDGDFERADDCLKEAEIVQFQSNTIVALKKQADLRVERGNAALFASDVVRAAEHFERSSAYFSGIDAALEAQHRHECVQQLRYYGYRYASHEALYAARNALHRNLTIWKKDVDTENWCRTKNALGGVGVRLAQFDASENAMSHLTDAREQYEAVRSVCSVEFLPRIYATASLDLANVVTDKRIAKTDEEYSANLQTGLELRLSALRFISKEKDAEAWGIIQHNLGCSYNDLSEVRKNEGDSVRDIKNAIHHAERSFEVRNPEVELQYWVASCRTLGEALLNMSLLRIVKNADEYDRRAFEVLSSAAARMSPREHPHQWSEIQQQLTKCKYGRAPTS